MSRPQQQTVTSAQWLAARGDSDAAALEPSEANYGLLFTSNPTPMFVFDSETLRIVAVNDAAMRHYGWSREEFLALTVLDVQPEEDRASALEGIPRYRGSLDTRIGTFRHCRKDGTVMEMDVTVSAIRFSGRPARLCSMNEVTERRQIERVLRQYELVVEQIRDILLFIRAVDGRILEANSAATAAYGYTHDELLELSIDDLRAPEAGAFTREQVTEVETNGMLFEAVHRRKDGSRFPVEVSARGVWIGETRAVVSVERDITERRRAEAALLEAHARTTSILESITDAFFSLDDQWRFVVVNPAAERAPLGRPAGELLGNVMWEVYPAIVGTPIHKHYLDAAETRSPQHYETKSPFNGRWYEVFVFPRSSGLDVYLRDIDDRKKAEEALRESEQRFRLALRNAPVSVAVQDGDLRYVWAFNPWWARPDQMVGKQDRDLFTEEEAKRLQSIKRWVLADNVEHREEMWVARPGGPMYLDVSFAPVHDEQGRPVGVGTATVDVTPIKRTEEALRAANERLAEAHERKNRFLAMLSHELRNPLTPIRNSLRVLELAAPGSEQAKRAQGVIARQSAQLVRLVDDLLDTARIARNKLQLQRQRLDLNPLAQGVVEDYRGLFDKAGIELETAFTTEPLPIDADAQRLTQAIGNLLNNAAKFTPPGGRVTVSTARLSEGQRAELRVRDTGAGIEPALLRRLFEPFTQAEATLDRSRGGLGLGLALVSGLVRMHGGQVTAHSDGPGKGARLVIELPLDTRVAQTPRSAPAVKKRRGRRVLIIEDNVDAAESLREVLEFGEHVVEVAHDGPKGLARAREFRPDVVVCDIGLPCMDGFEVARAFRADAVLKRIALVALSGYARPEDLERAAEAGFRGHLAKPPNLDELERLLEELPAGPGGS